jgi:hypothetical protein
MLVHSLWDQEDIYGAIAVYKAIEPKDTGNDKVFLVLGPGITARRSATAARSALEVRQRHRALLPQAILPPFLDHFLKDDAPRLEVAVGARSRRHDKWRALCPRGLLLRERLCDQSHALYL